MIEGEGQRGCCLSFTPNRTDVPRWVLAFEKLEEFWREFKELISCLVRLVRKRDPGFWLARHDF